jgi:two-component sensor histidine kinase
MSKSVLRLGPSSPQAFLFAIACVLAATALRQVFGYFGATLFFATYFPVILVVGLFAGSYAALFATALSSLIVWWAFVPPVLSFGPPGFVDLINFALFWVSAGFSIWVTHLYRRTVIKLVEADAARTLLINELNHRLGNTFAIIQAVINGTVDNKQIVQRLSGRIEALSRANKLVTATTVEAISLIKILRTEISAYCALDRLRLDGPPIEVCGEAARSISLIVHELTTNAAKYGSLSKSNGTVEVRWSDEDGHCQFHWREIDGPPVVTPERTGFGSKLIRASLVSLDGTIKHEYHSNGYECEIRIPKAKLIEKQTESGDVSDLEQPASG